MKKKELDLKTIKDLLRTFISENRRNNNISLEFALRDRFYSAKEFNNAILKYKDEPEVMDLVEKLQDIFFCNILEGVNAKQCDQWIGQALLKNRHEFAMQEEKAEAVNQGITININGNPEKFLEGEVIHAIEEKI